MTVSTGDTRRDVPPVVEPDSSTTPNPRSARAARLGFPTDLRPWRECGLVVAVVAPILVVVYRLWDAHLRVPFSDRLDALSTSAYVKSIIENGWYFHNPRLGAPFVADWRDFPVGGENVHWLSLKVLGLVTGDYASAVNLYFLLGFFLIAISAYFVARYLRFGVAVSLVVGVLYAFAPYHAFRSTIQVARGVYYVVPVAVLVLLWAAAYRTELLSTVDGRVRWRRGRVATAVVVAVVLGSSDTQNAAFLVTLLALVTLVAAVRDRDWRPLALLALVGAVAMGTLLVNNVPYLLNQREHGTNVVANRSLREQDEFGLRPVNLVLPVPGHRVGFLSDLAADSATGQATDSETGGTSLGLVGTIGLIASIGAVAVAALGARRRDPRSELLARLGFLNLAAILIGAIGGFSFLLALAGFTQYRTWNRISLFIAFASLLATAVLLERARDAIGRRTTASNARILVVAGAGVLIVVGVLDQVPTQYVPDYAALAARFDQDATFYHRLERRLPKGATVFDLPVSGFPEVGPIVNLPDYAQFAGYLHTDDLRFSYGAMKGRPQADWIHNLAECDAPLLVSQLASAGYDAAVVDTRGYADGGTALLDAVRPLTGAPMLRSADGHLLALDLRALRARMKAEVGSPTVRDWGEAVIGTAEEWHGFADEELACPVSRRWATRPDPTITLSNSTDRPMRLRFTSNLEADPRATSVTVDAPGAHRTVALTGGRGRIDETLVVPTGSNTIRFRLTGPRVQPTNQDPRTLWFTLVNTNLQRTTTPTIARWSATAARG